MSHLQDACGMSLGETVRDGSVTVEQVFCLGNCALGPAGAGQRPAARPGRPGAI